MSFPAFSGETLCMERVKNEEKLLGILMKQRLLSTNCPTN